MKQQATHENTLRDALLALPVVAPPDDVWAQIERRTRTGSAHRVGWWLAIAATVVVAIAAAVLVLTRAPEPAAGGIAVLVAQSQQLERRVVLYRAESTDAWDASRRALLYRIADLDRDLAPLSVDPTQNLARTETLWRQRVALMQSLAEIDRADAARRRTFTL